MSEETIVIITKECKDGKHMIVPPTAEEMKWKSEFYCHPAGIGFTCACGKYGVAYNPKAGTFFWTPTLNITPDPVVPDPKTPEPEVRSSEFESVPEYLIREAVSPTVLPTMGNDAGDEAEHAIASQGVETIGVADGSFGESKA